MELRTKHFEIDPWAFVIHAFGHTACWMRGDGKLIVDRPDGSAWLLVARVRTVDHPR
jgi:hypothetical protein